MSISFTCACGATLHVPPEKAEQRCKCPKCGRAVTAPVEGPPQARDGYLSRGGWVCTLPADSPTAVIPVARFFSPLRSLLSIWGLLLVAGVVLLFLGEWYFIFVGCVIGGIGLIQVTAFILYYWTDRYLGRRVVLHNDRFQVFRAYQEIGRVPYDNIADVRIAGKGSKLYLGVELVDPRRPDTILTVQQRVQRFWRRKGGFDFPLDVGNWQRLDFLRHQIAARCQAFMSQR